MVNIRSWTKRRLSPHTLDAQGNLSLGALLLLGVFAGLLQVHLRYPLNIPGHHGLEWMALLLFGRCLAQQRHAATTLACAAAVSYLMQSPFVAAAHSVKPAFIFLLTGVCCDAIYRVSRNYLPLTVNAGLIGGLAFIAKPLVMYLLFLFAGLKVGMFVKHPDYLPFLSHFLFGMVGGIGGAMLAKAVLSVGIKK